MSRMAAPVSLDVHGRQVIVTHPGRVVFPAHNDQKGYTKFDLVRYYLAVAEGARRRANYTPTWPMGVVLRR